MLNAQTYVFSLSIVSSVFDIADMRASGTAALRGLDFPVASRALSSGDCDWTAFSDMTAQYVLLFYRSQGK